MEKFISVFNTINGVGVVLLQVFAVLLLVSLVFYHKKPNVLLSFTSKNAYSIGFFISTMSMVLSLVYSEIVGFAPCMLCWYQRIFMYPQAFLFGMSVWKKEKLITDYSLVLAIVGLTVSIYHNFLSWLPSVNLPCSATGPSCTMLYTNIFGYITIPVMSMTGFMVVILSLLIMKNRTKFALK
jgi:disulfide bond formation protein DsbB